MLQTNHLQAVARLLFAGDDAVPVALRGPIFDAGSGIDARELAVLDAELAEFCEGRPHLECVDALYQVGRANRRRDGVFYTPSGLARWLVDRTLDGVSKVALRIGDPCCGCGSFLVAAVDSLVERGMSIDGICGTDLDANAVEIARVAVYRRVRQHGVCTDGLASRLTTQIRVGDGLTDLDNMDVVVSNPPFGAAITSDTVRSAAEQARHGSLFPDVARGAYDLSFIFAAAAVESLVPGGRYGLVLPRSVLSLASASGLRGRLEARAPAQILWAPDEAKLFEGADIFVALVVGQRAHSRGPVAVSSSSPGPDGGPSDPLNTVARWSGETWSAALLPEYALASTIRSRGVDLVTLGEVATVHGGAATGAAYDLRPYVTEGGSGLKLVTTGLIDRYVCRWGAARCRYLKSDYHQPRWPGPRDDAPTSVARAAARQTGPKVLVGGLSKVIEAVADASGELGGVVSTWVVRPLEEHPNALWLLEAFLNSPALSLIYMTDFRGKGLSGGNTTIGQRELKTLPMPADFARLALDAVPLKSGGLLEVFATDAGEYGQRVRLASWVLGATTRRGVEGGLEANADVFACAAIARLFGLDMRENEALGRWFGTRVQANRHVITGVHG